MVSTGPDAPEKTFNFRTSMSGFAAGGDRTLPLSNTIRSEPLYQLHDRKSKWDVTSCFPIVVAPCFREVNESAPFEL